MANAIQLAALLTFAAAIFYLASLTFREWRLSTLVAGRQSIEGARLRAEADEILERTRVRREQTDGAWSGFRKFRVARKVEEAEDICSFYFEPHDGRPLPPFHPGQFLNFQLKVPGKEKPVLPCYSLSDCSNPEYYRVTIKRQGPPPSAPDAPPGVSSSHFHDRIEVGAIVDIKSPRGQFFLDSTRSTPVVLIGGGIGITPVLSMLNHIAVTNSRRETWLFLGVRHGGEHVMKTHLQEIVDEYPNLNLVVAYSNPRDGEDVEGRDYTEKGWVSTDLFKKLPCRNNFLSGLKVRDEGARTC